MDFQSNKRVYLYNILKKAKEESFIKKKFIGAGAAGAVYKFCTSGNSKTAFCVAGKKNYITKSEARHIDDRTSQKALKNSVYIEEAAASLVNKLILQNISPHYALNYKNITTKREHEPCSKEFPYKITFYNEYIEGITYGQWVEENHTIDEWYNAYFQITVGIYALKKYFNMTHLDFHAENILVKKVKKGGYWKYIIDDVEYYVPNLGYIFYIIDFGHAWIPGKFKSWFITQLKNPKNIHQGYDIMSLFKYTLGFSTSPPQFKKKIRSLIKNLRNNQTYQESIHNIWGKNYTIVKNENRILDIFNLNKKLK